MVKEILTTDSTEWWFEKKTDLWVNGPGNNKKDKQLCLLYGLCKTDEDQPYHLSAIPCCNTIGNSESIPIPMEY